MKTIEEWVKDARALLSELWEQEAKFFLFLVESETKPLVQWKGAFTSFEQFIDSEHLCSPARYTSFKKSLGRLPANKAPALGVDGFVRAARVEDETKRNLVVQELMLRTEARGTQLSAREAERVVQQIAPVERPARFVARALQASKLQQENASLRKRVKMLEAENAKLLDKIAKLEGKKKGA